jgi:hypothetical protein
VITVWPHFDCGLSHIRQKAGLKSEAVFLFYRSEAVSFMVAKRRLISLHQTIQQFRKTKKEACASFL